MLSEYNLKAVVFDDVEAEAKPLIDALNYERIPNIFINFGEDTREDKKLKNIRLIFADIILGTQKGGDPDAIVEAIKGSILDNIDDDNGPFILVAWSKDADTLSDTLSDRLREANDKLNFLSLNLDKNEYFENHEDEWKLKDDKTFQDIKNDINAKLNTLNHLPIFLEWERDARDTVSLLLNDFIGNIADEEQVKNTISSAIKLTLGKKTDATTEEKIKSFYQTLNTTLADSIVNNSNPIEQHEDFLDTLDLETIDDNMKAEINRKTLFENPIDNELKTGNIYSFEDFKDLFYGDVIKDVCGCDYENILESDLFRYTKKCKFFNKEAGEADSVHQKRHYLKMEEMAFPILFEFTPSCDIANNKYKKSRLIFGYMINSQYACMENESESLYITKFHFQYNDRGLDGNYRLVFFIKNIFAVNPEKVKELTPMIRARKEFATDLQHSIANHISRIGISSLDL